MRYVAKPAIVLSLFIYFSLQTRGIEGTLYFKIALLLSLAGDIALMFEDRDPSFFMIGLACFLLAHISYIVAFSGIRKRYAAIPGQPRWRSHWLFNVLTGVYVGALYMVLKDYLGDLKIPVLVYALTIAIMLVNVANAFPRIYSRPGVICLAGALFFVISDSLLAINKFYMGFPMAGIAIMVTYALAQYLLTIGASRTYSNPNFAPHPVS